jgi:chemotaxis regulatin CheY-phosphate phosphatase CheZ
MFYIISALVARAQTILEGPRVSTELWERARKGNTQDQDFDDVMGQVIKIICSGLTLFFSMVVRIKTFLIYGKKTMKMHAYWSLSPQPFIIT